MKDREPTQDEIRDRMQRMTRAYEGFTAESLDELREKSEDEAEDVRLIAASRLGFLEDVGAVPVLVKLMDDVSGRVRGMAAIGLGTYAAEAARDVLIQHLETDVSGDVRAMCVTALGDIGGADQSLIAALKDPHSHVRMSAVTSLNRLGNTEAAPQILGLLDDPEWIVRYFACCASLDFGVGDQRIVDALIALRDNPEAVETAQTFAVSDVLRSAMEKYADDFDELEEEASPEQILDFLRQKHGEQEIPYPPQDPLGEMIDRAKDLLVRSPQ